MPLETPPRSRAPPEPAPDSAALNHWLAVNPLRVEAMGVLVAALGVESFLDAISVALADPDAARRKIRKHVKLAHVPGALARRTVRMLTSLPVALPPHGALQMAYDRVALEFVEVGLSPADVADLPRDHVRVINGAVHLWRFEGWEELVLDWTGVNAAFVWLGFRGRGAGPALGSIARLGVSVGAGSIEAAVRRARKRRG